jgi:hypothetical protein
MTKAKQVAIAFISRADQLEYRKGTKKLDIAALEFFCGAATACIGTPDEQHMGINAYLVAIRGFSHVKELAES